MNLDELRSVQSKERSKDSLQHLRESFYADVGTYIRGLREERERAAERVDDPFDSAEINQLTDEIQTAEEVVEAVYERRVGKVVKRASLAAAGIPADEEGLTSEEQVLFADLVDRIEANKTTVLDVLAGEGSTTSESSADDAEPDSVPDDRPTAEASAVAGDDGSIGTETESSEPPSPEPSAREPDPNATEPDGSASVAPDSPTEHAAGGSTPHESDANADGHMSSDTDSGSESMSESEPKSESTDDRTTVRITRDIGSIFGVDEREYDLTAEDVVALPSENAGPLIERDAAEKLE